MTLSQHIEPRKVYRVSHTTKMQTRVPLEKAVSACIAWGNDETETRYAFETGRPVANPWATYTTSQHQDEWDD